MGRRHEAAGPREVRALAVISLSPPRTEQILAVWRCETSVLRTQRSMTGSLSRRRPSPCFPRHFSSARGSARPSEPPVRGDSVPGKEQGGEMILSMAFGPMAAF